MNTYSDLILQKDIQIMELEERCKMWRELHKQVIRSAIVLHGMSLAAMSLYFIGVMVTLWK